ncbi:hypothetical protein [Bacillus halotolerans]|uniref:Uncharacterized protein n=1 Tax=Bacillus halotolerans TaxID=260554 RepID=A0A9Q4EMU2_9BACI|nr:hypothetical protein [Bacillus halotolerans]MCY9186471.1 hypothetical protein [Bacillus halotolerans]MED3625650.1 hypothetical protein [Bacillus subtilis]
MGCDIHAFVEVKRYPYQDRNRSNGVWISADKWTVNEDHIFYPEDYEERFHVDDHDSIYRGRNYHLFSILAGVRNYRGLTPISSPKGLPKDVCIEIKNESDFFASDGHSHSYLTLKELLQYNWDEEIEAVDFADSKELAIEEYGDKIISINPSMVGVKVTYKATLREMQKDFFMTTVEKMKSFLKDSEYPYREVREDDIRLVFWFDN